MADPYRAHICELPLFEDQIMPGNENLERS